MGWCMEFLKMETTFGYSGLRSPDGATDFYGGRSYQKEKSQRELHGESQVDPSIHLDMKPCAISAATV